MDAPQVENEKAMTNDKIRMTNEFQISNFKYIAMILIAASIFASGCGRKESDIQGGAISAGGSPGKSASAMQQQPMQQEKFKASDGVKHKVSTFDLEGLADNGSKKWDVKGQSAETVDENQVKLKKITATSYGKDAQATITADKGLYDRSKNNVRLEQNVKAVIENTPGAAANFIMMPEKNTPGADKSKKTTTTINCDGEVEFNYDKNEGYFNKNVRVVNDDGTIDSDRIKIYLDSGTKQISKIVAEGNVRIHRGDNISYSDKATYFAADKKIVLAGKPRIVIVQDNGSQENFLGLTKK